MPMETARKPDILPVGSGQGNGHATEAGRRLVDALAARDRESLVGVLAEDSVLRYLIPHGPGQEAGAAGVADRFFKWFGDADRLEFQGVDIQPIAGRASVRYRVLVHENEGWELVEQQAYFDVDPDGRIVTIDLLCSGFRPISGPADPTAASRHEFDAGAMGCADGLAVEFRRRISAIPIGDVLVVTARDPAAKEDLPPLARLMGHTVRSVEAPGDGRLLITVERGR